jgi:hypothetical protein
MTDEIVPLFPYSSHNRAIAFHFLDRILREFLKEIKTREPGNKKEK